jgi:hypothetical protein
MKSAAVMVTHVTVRAVSLDNDGVVALEVEDDNLHRIDVAYSAFGTTS